MKKIFILMIFVLQTACCPFPWFWDYEIVPAPKSTEETSPYTFKRWEELKNQYDYRIVRRLAGDGLLMNLMTMSVSAEEADACRVAGENNDYLKLYVGFQAYKNYDEDTYLFDPAQLRIIYKNGEETSNGLFLTEVRPQIYNVAGKRNAKYSWRRVFVFSVCASEMEAVEIDGITRNGQPLPPYRLELFPSMFDSDSFMGNWLK